MLKEMQKVQIHFLIFSLRVISVPLFLPRFFYQAGGNGNDTRPRTVVVTACTSIKHIKQESRTQ